jgi:hypothetical protein
MVCKFSMLSTARSPRCTFFSSRRGGRRAISRKPPQCCHRLSTDIAHLAVVEYRLFQNERITPDAASDGEGAAADAAVSRFESDGADHASAACISRSIRRMKAMTRGLVTATSGGGSNRWNAHVICPTRISELRVASSSPSAQATRSRQVTLRKTATHTGSEGPARDVSRALCCELYRVNPYVKHWTFAARLFCSRAMVPIAFMNTECTVVLKCSRMKATNITNITRSSHTSLISSEFQAALRVFSWAYSALYFFARPHGHV